MKMNQIQFQAGRACKINCVNGHSWLQPVTIGGTHDHSQRHARCLDEGLQES